MAKKSASDWKKEGDELKKIFASAKNKEHSFGLCIAQEGCALAAHPQHDADKMFSAAKKMQGATANGARGKMTVKGTTIIFQCETEPPGALASKFKQYLAQCKLQYKAQFLLPGEEAESADGEPAEEAVEAEHKPASGGGDRGDAAKDADGESDGEFANPLAAAFEHVSQVCELSLPGMDPGQAKELKAALKNIADALSKGDLVRAENMLNQLGLLTGITKNSSMKPHRIVLPAPGSGKSGKKLDKRGLNRARIALKPKIKQALDASPDDSATIKKLVKNFDTLVRKDKLDDANDVLNELTEAVEDILKAAEMADEE